jgi:hypothetical protein
MPRPDPVTPASEHEAEVRRRQRSRSIVTAALLIAFVVLVYAISIAKMVK